MGGGGERRLKGVQTAEGRANILHSLIRMLYVIEQRMLCPKENNFLLYILRATHILEERKLLCVSQENVHCKMQIISRLRFYYRHYKTASHQFLPCYGRYFSFRNISSLLVFDNLRENKFSCSFLMLQQNQLQCPRIRIISCHVNKDC